MAVQVSGDPDPANNGLFHIYADHLGSSGSLSDSSGVYIPNSHAKYTPFGDWRTEPTATAGDRYYTNHKHNNLGGGVDDLGLIYMNARYYLPGVGRFASADTVVPNAANPQSYNRYSYAYNNPIKLFDPTGHVVEDAHNGSSCNERNGDICDPSADYGTTYPPGHEKEGEWIPRPIEPDPVAKIIITVVSFVPGIGEVIDVVDITLAVKNGNYDEAAIIAALAALPGASRAYREGGSVALRGIRGIGDEAAGPLRRTVNSALDCLFNSFTADMLVMTSRGLVPIGDIEEGEYVYAYDEIDDVFNYHPVTKVWAHTGSEIVNISIEGETITATLGHPFYSQDGWVAAGELSVGSQLFQADGSWGIVEQLNFGFTNEAVYNLTVQEAHTFFVGKGEWLVHNCRSQGEVLANTANNALQRLKDDNLKGITIGTVMQENGRPLLAIYGRNDVQAIQKLREAGFDVLDAAPRGVEYHAERQLYDLGYDTIGISRQGGMCESCSNYIPPGIVTPFRRK